MTDAGDRSGTTGKRAAARVPGVRTAPPRSAGLQRFVPAGPISAAPTTPITTRGFVSGVAVAFTVP
ncbi:hypothetical protein ACFVU0_32995 [Streptomyces sp. NPDC058122]|uniref:hypothetical protein n=1 Tax=Streptomyces sp. NPDC058122 TaxID=3346349 RepID=UPI0036EBB6A1